MSKEYTDQCRAHDMPRMPVTLLSQCRLCLEQVGIRWHIQYPLPCMPNVCIQVWLFHCPLFFVAFLGYDLWRAVMYANCLTLFHWLLHDAIILQFIIPTMEQSVTLKLWCSTLPFFTHDESLLDDLLHCEKPIVTAEIICKAQTLNLYDFWHQMLPETTPWIIAQRTSTYPWLGDIYLATNIVLSYPWGSASSSDPSDCYQDDGNPKTRQWHSTTRLLRPNKSTLYWFLPKASHSLSLSLYYHEFRYSSSLTNAVKLCGTDGIWKEIIHELTKKKINQNYRVQAIMNAMPGDSMLLLY